MTELDEGTKEAVRTGLISGAMRNHCFRWRRSLSTRLVRLAIAGNWSVRERASCQADSGGGVDPAATKDVDSTKSHLADLEGQLAEHLGARVHIQQQGKKAGKGKLVIEYFDLDQFDGLSPRWDSSRRDHAFARST